MPDNRRPPLLRRIYRTVVIALLCGVACLPSLRAPGDVPISVQCRTAYDDDYFYVAAEVDKDTLRGSVSAPFQDPYQDDCVAVYLAAVPSGERVEMAVSVAQGAQLYRGADRRGLKGVEDFFVGPDGAKLLFKYRLRARGVVNGPPVPNNGFSVELAIPWIELGGPPRPGAVYRFNVAVFEGGSEAPRIASFAPSVRSREEATDVQRWGHIVFTDAPVASITGAPGAAVCSRVYNVKPVIDGAIAEGEWSRVTAFAFSGVTGPRTMGMGSSASARRREPTDLRPATPPGPLVVRKSPQRPQALQPQAWPRLVYARYRSDYQCDMRKALPLRSVAAPNGQTLLASHPMDGTGPWLTYDRIDWHRIQLSRMREAGIDVAAVTFRPSWEGRLALTAMGAALRTMDALRMAHPQVALWLDATDMGSGSDVPERLYRAIRMFLECVPESAVVRVPLTGNNGPGSAVVVVVAGLSGQMLDSAIPFVHSRIAEDGEDPLLVLAFGDPSERADAAVGDASATGCEISARGAVRTASIYAGAIARTPGEHPLARRSPSEYRQAWRKVLSAKVDWVFIESWNDNFAGTEIAPTVEYGLQYPDITRAFAAAFVSRGSSGGSMIGHNMPAAAVAGAKYAVRLILRNDGSAPWNPTEAMLGAAWDGGAVTPVGALPVNIQPGDVLSIPVQLNIPSTAGDHALGLYLLVQRNRSRNTPTAAAQRFELGRLSMRVLPGDAAQPAASVVEAAIPRGLETPSSYRVAVTVRNEGATSWPRGETAITARLLRGEAGSEAVVPDMAEARAVLSEDVLPGAEATVTVPLTLARADGTPFRFSTDAGPRYLLRFDIDISGERAATIPTLPHEIQLVETDAGVVFYNDYTPARLPAQRRVPVPIGVRNRGPQTWLKDRVAVGYHWYYLDGTEAVWEDEVFPLKTDVPPGSEIGDVGAWVTAPPHDGTYWLVWDMRLGDTWVSTLPGTRAYETRVTLVQVVEGKLVFVDLKSAADVRAAAPPDGGGRGSFHEDGRAYPEELMPPYAVNVPLCATLWLPEKRSGTGRSREISFRWLPSSGPSAVACKGQEITVADRKHAPVARRVHVLAAATQPGQGMAVTLRFTNGSEQYSSFPVAAWDSIPTGDSLVAHAMPYARRVQDASVGPPVFVYWHTVQVRELLPLTAIVLGNAPAVRVFAITVER